MSFKPDDISQIRRYLSGELDARAMHRLERRAQDDPFLMDALEGYSNRKDQFANLEEMQQKLQRRIRKGMNQPVALWPLIAVAASVLVFITLGAWWVLFYEPQAAKKAIIQADRTAVVVKPVEPVNKPKPAAPSPQAVVSSASPAIIASAPIHDPAEKARQRPERVVINSAAVINSPLTVTDYKKAQPVFGDTARKSNMLAEVAVIGYAIQQKKDVSASVTTISPSLNYNAVTPLNKADTGQTKRFITGRVLDANDHQPLQGVVAKIQGAQTGTTTDAQGNFKLEATKNDVVDIGYIGYVNKQVKAKKDNLQIALEPSNTSLNEVVIAGYDSKRNNQVAAAQPVAPKPQPKKLSGDSNLVATSDIPITAANGFRRITGSVKTVIGGVPIPEAIIWNKSTDRQYATDNKGNFLLDARKGDELFAGYSGFKNERVVVGKKDKINIELEQKGASMYDSAIRGMNFNPFDDLAHPAIGWEKFRALQNKAKSPDGKTGTVKLKFTVNVDNTLSDFTVLESLSAAADAEAIRFIKEDNKWLHNTNNKPEVLTLKIKFKN